MYDKSEQLIEKQEYSDNRFDLFLKKTEESLNVNTETVQYITVKRKTLEEALNEYASELKKAISCNKKIIHIENYSDFSSDYRLYCIIIFED